MMQQQNFSLAALAKRDAQADPFAPATAAPAPEPEPEPEDEEEDDVSEDELRAFLKRFDEGLRCSI
jgi:hypothetical protein